MLLPSSSRLSQQPSSKSLYCWDVYSACHGMKCSAQRYSTINVNGLCAIFCFYVSSINQHLLLRSTFHNQSGGKTVTPVQPRYCKNHRPAGSIWGAGDVLERTEGHLTKCCNPHCSNPHTSKGNRLPYTCHTYFTSNYHESAPPTLHWRRAEVGVHASECLNKSLWLHKQRLTT